MAVHEARCGTCHEILTIQVDVDLSDIQIELAKIRAVGDSIVSALDNLKAADDALKAEVTTFLADIAGRLSGNTDADVQAVADDINAEVAALQAGDSATAPAAPEQPQA